MSFLEKLKFWNHDDSDDMFGDSGSDPFASDSSGNDSFGSSQSSDPLGGGSADPFASSPNTLNTPQSQPNNFSSESSDPFASEPSPSMSNQGNMDMSAQNQNLNQDYFGSGQEQPAPQNTEMQQSAPTPTQGAQMAHDYMNKKETPLAPKDENFAHHPMEVLNLKLDSIRTTMDNIDLRLRKLESMIEKDNKRAW